MRRAAATLMLAFALMSCSTLATKTTTATTVRSIPRLEQLTLDEKIGQLFVYAAHGVYMSESSTGYRTLLQQVRDNKVGGVIWFVSNVYETAWLNHRLQAEARVPLLISADLEAGSGMRFTDTTYWPPAMAVGASGDPSLAEKQGHVSARESRTLGVNHILAPVSDVNVNPDNPVINARSFGEDPAAVAQFVAAFVRGCQAEGVLATAKHFPGHGDTRVDSHRSLPILDFGRERLDAVELVPFRAAIAAGVGSIMIGHLSVPSLDATPAPVRDMRESTRDNPYGSKEEEIPEAATLPATVSSPIIEGLLRKDLGFQGLVVTDAFDMGGLVAHFDAGEGAVRAIEAGEDQIIKSADTTAAIAAVKEAVRSGRITERRIDASVRRILAAKERVHMTVGSQEDIFRTVDGAEHRAVAEEIARRAMTLVREEPGTLPLSREARIVTLVVSDFPELSNPLAELERSMSSRARLHPRTFLLDPRSDDAETRPFVEAAKEADVVVLALAIRARSGAGHMAIPDVARRAINSVPASVKTIAISFGSPYIIRDLPQVRTYLCAYGVQPVLQSAAARALYGEAPITGKLPVTIPGLHQRGEGISKP